MATLVLLQTPPTFTLSTPPSSNCCKGEGPLTWPCLVLLLLMVVVVLLPLPLLVVVLLLVVVVLLLLVVVVAPQLPPLTSAPCPT